MSQPLFYVIILNQQIIKQHIYIYKPLQQLFPFYLMLPYIGSHHTQVKKKQPIIIPQQLTKQWNEIKKQIQTKSKTIQNKITIPILNDFNKICKLKDIPQFYLQYLLIAVQRLTEEQVGQVLALQIKEIINNCSNYHKISGILQSRPIILKNIQDKLEIAQGFQDMNVGKTIKTGTRNKINQLIKQATTLQDIKDMQNKSILELVNEIIKLRNNALAILQTVKNWRQYLNNIANSKKIKYKIIFPIQGFNCILLPLYDQNFIFTSFLSRQFNIGEQNNPFIMIGKKIKRKNQFGQCFINYLNQDIQNYDTPTIEIIKQLKLMKEKTKMQPILEKESNLPKNGKSLVDIESILLKNRSKKRKQHEKISQVDVKQEIQEKQKQAQIQNSNKKVKKIMNIYSTPSKTNQQLNKSNDKINQIISEKIKLQKYLKEAKQKNKQFEKLIKKIDKGQSSQNRNKKQIKDINKSDVLIQPVTNTKYLRNIKTPEQERLQFKNKVQSIYRSRQNRKIHHKLSNKQLQNSSLNDQDLLNDKRSLQKQLKNQIKQKQDLERLLKKSQKQTDKKLQNSKLEKSILQQKIQQLQSKITKNNSPQQSPQVNQKLEKSKASIASVYINQQNKIKKFNTPITNLYQSKLIEQKQQRMSIQKQMKQVIKQKHKLEQTIQKSQNMVNKQKQVMDKKIEKYQKTIQKLKQQHNQLRLKKSVLLDDLVLRKKSQSLKMYTTTPITNQEQTKEKEKSLRKNSSNVQSANYFKLPPEIKKSKLKQKTILEKDEEQQKSNQLITSRNLNKVEIIKTKKTIQIIYQSNRRIKNKNKQKDKDKDNLKQSVVEYQNNQELQKIKKEKQTLLLKLEREGLKRQQQEKAKERKGLKQEGQLQKYKQIIEKQRQRKFQLQNKIKSLKRQLYDEFQQKLKNQKLKFQQQKRQLLIMVQNQKNQKQLKQKYLNNQIKFFKEMQANENELIKLLQTQKRNRLQKQKQLATEIGKKQQLLQILQIQQIKKGIQWEIRKQLQKDNDQQSEQQINIQQKKDQLKMQIQQMNQQKNQQLKQIDEQNQKLKALITRIKNQQSKLLNAIKQNIDQQSQQEQYQQLKTQEKQLIQKYPSKSIILQKTNSKYYSHSQQNNFKQTDINKKIKSIGNQSAQQIDIKEVERMFQSRLKAQEEHQNNMRSAFKKIRQSPEYQQKEQVQNLIEMYLKNPHEYPAQKKTDYSPQQKADIQEQVLKKSKMAGQFERQLLQLRQVQKFVPTADDDIMTSHLLNLKRVYQQKQSSALKQQLFPALKHDQKYHNSDLSFQSQQTPPPKTIRQHVQFHAKNFPIKKQGSKNFLTINRMRVAMLEQNRKDKQKQFIEEQAKRKAQGQIMKKNLRLIQQQRYKKSVEKRSVNLKQQIQIKNKKMNQKQKNKKVGKQQKNLHQNIKQNVNKQIKQDDAEDQDQLSQKQQNSIDIQKYKQKNDKTNQHQQQQKDYKQKPQQKQQQQQINQNQQIDRQRKQQQRQINQNQQIDRQRKQLQQDIQQYQQQIRSFVSKQDKYQIYQQFVQNTQIQSYIKTLFQISSKQIKGLNNNKTIFKDIQTYKSVIILIAKDKEKQVQVGIGVFHKQFQDQLYVCDYVLAHNMRNFLTLIFNFSRFIFKVDTCTNKIQFFFDLDKLVDEISILHFIQFQEKCKRMGEVYVKVGADKARKYALRRNLFQPIDKIYENEGKGIQFQVSLEIHGDFMKQAGQGFINSKNIQYFSSTALLSAYLKNNQEDLAIFRKNSEEDLRYRQLLLTALMFQKKEIELKNCQHKLTSTQQRLQITKKLKDKFIIQDPIHQVQYFNYKLSQLMPQKTKRCTFNIDEQQINYIIYIPSQAITKIQSSNSSETGIFLNLVPKYKMLIIQANQFLNMNEVNPEVNVFFYIKNFVKNIVDVRKQEHSRVFLPEFSIKNQVFLKDLSSRLKKTIFVKQNIKLGWNNVFSNSLIFTPSHKDLVIKKPFIICLMSAAVQRTIEGTPICATLID